MCQAQIALMANEINKEIAAAAAVVVHIVVTSSALEALEEQLPGANNKRERLSSCQCQAAWKIGVAEVVRLNAFMVPHKHYQLFCAAPK